MRLVCVFICAFIGIIGYFFERKIYSPTGTFGCFWAFVLFLARLQFFGMYEASIRMYLLVTTGVLMFAFGAFASSILKIRLKIYKSSDRLNMIVYKVFVVITFFILLVNVTPAVRLLINGRNVSDIYILLNQSNLGYINEMSKSQFINILTTFIGNPLTFLLVPTSVVQYFITNDKRYLIISCFFSFAFVISKGGRAGLVFLISYVLLTMSILEKKITLTPKIKRYLKVFILLTFSFIIYMTIQRGSVLVESLYKYYAGAIPHSDIRINELDKFSYTLGLSSMQGFIRPIFSIFEKLGIHEPSFLSYVYDISYVENPMIIGDSMKFNAFVTAFYYFYLDGGWMGVIIGSLVFGYIVQRTYWNAMNKLTVKSISLFILLYIQGILFSMVRIQFVVIAFAWAFVYSIFLYLPVIRIKYVKSYK